MSQFIRAVAFWSASVSCALFNATAAANAAPLASAHAVNRSDTSALVKVHSRWNDDDDVDDEDDADRRYYRHRYARYHDQEVDAPFTHVETGHRVIVDAPFAHVYVGRHGRHVVAPFVNIWIPR